LSIIEELYILSKDGRPLYLYSPIKSEIDIVGATLFSGILSAIQGAMSQLDEDGVTNFTTNKKEVFVRGKEEITYVIVTSTNNPISKDAMNSLLDQIVDKVTISHQIGDDISIDESANNFYNTIVEMIINQWEKENKESKATQKLKKVLW
jgi:predicted regulator of Ras-like GTPase activity (Roadblock/LC7/MglB family)